MWAGLAASASASLLCLGIIAALTPARYRFLWHRHYTNSDHFKEWTWSKCVYLEYGSSLDDSRARALDMWRPELWCNIDVEKWRREKWVGWTADPPVWFTEEWVAARIPGHLHP